MKTNIAILFIALLALSACVSTPDTASSSTAAPIVAHEAPEDKAVVAAIADTGQSTAESLSSERLQEVQKKSVYFDLDQFEIKPEYRDLIRQQADFMRANAGTVTLEGNSDERGSAEFNLALGNKRARAVSKALQVLGVQGDRIEVVSYGEEKPRSYCHEERCWSDNRRVDFNGKLGKP